MIFIVLIVDGVGENEKNRLGKGAGLAIRCVDGGIINRRNYCSNTGRYCHSYV